MKERKEYISNKSILIGIVCFALWIGVFYLFHIITQPNPSRSWMLFTNPALNYYELEEMITSNKIVNLSREIEDYAAYKSSLWDISHLSVFYRNLNNGWSFWVNEKEEFSPASLMKLPVLIAYMKKSESIPWFLDQKVVYTKDPNIPQYKQNIPPEVQLKEWQEYTIREICEYMIKYSDNHASSFLEKNIPFEDLQKTFTDIWISFPEFKNGQFDNNVKIIEYASFLRILFNASYLNRDNSEKALNLLSKVDFHDWINQWVPEDIPVAHKFGERGIIWPNWREEKQLHDCGIVYYPNHPYVLCVMTRWYDRNVLKNSILEVSRMIYDEVKLQYGDNPLDTSNNGTNKNIINSQIENPTTWE